MLYEVITTAVSPIARPATLARLAITRANAPSVTIQIAGVAPNSTMKVKPTARLAIHHQVTTNIVTLYPNRNNFV